MDDSSRASGNTSNLTSGRSRSLTRSIAENVSRSLSRTMRKLSGAVSSSEDEMGGEPRSTRKKECTCPAEDVMLTSCPRHGEKAAKILAKRKAKEAKKEEARQRKESARKQKEDKKMAASVGGRSRSSRLLDVESVASSAAPSTATTQRANHSRRPRGRAVGGKELMGSHRHDPASTISRQGTYDGRVRRSDLMAEC